MIEQNSSPERLSSHISLREQILDALHKDAGPLGDVTSLALIEKERLATAEFILKAESGVLSGLSVAQTVFELIDPQIEFTPLASNGDLIHRGDVFATIAGPARAILTGERVALEFLRRLSGIASKTQDFVKAVEGTGTIILDTRKTLPGFGMLDKQAVRDGGGTNHRANLSEMGLIKNNHLDVLNGDTALAITLFRKKYPQIPLEIEVRNEDELLSSLTSTPDRILLDNMTKAETRRAVHLRNEFAAATGTHIPLEASGNMTLDRVRGVAETGVEFISVGSLTHSVEALDLSLHISIK